MKRTQRQEMIKLVAHFGLDDSTSIINSYAELEQNGTVSRKKNKNNMSSLNYAKGLYKDCIRRGWAIV